MRAWIFFFSVALYGCPFCDPFLLEHQNFLENENALGICTNHPVVPGHVLIIPRRHVERFEELTDQEVSDIASIIRRIHTAATALFGNSDYLLLQKNGKSAGQSVFHVHVHYYPRSPELGTCRFLWRFLTAPYLKATTEEEMEQQVSIWREYYESALPTRAL